MVLFINVAAKLLIQLVVALLVVNLAGAESEGQAEQHKYQNLLEALHPSTRSTTFVPFTEFAEDPDRKDHDTCLAYLRSQPELVEQIRDELECEEVQWQLQKMSYRLLYIPESREDVAELFIDYSREAIADLLARTGLSDPYASISTQMGDGPELTDDQPIRAIVVQDLAREYKARYQFSGTTEKKVDLGLSGQSSIDEVGSYYSYLEYSEDTGDWRFYRDRQTIWKTISANPYTVLMTPLEETLHIALRRSTEKAILQALGAIEGLPSLKEAEEVVEQWLAVEEGIVGGVVYHLVPEVVLTRIPDLPEEWIQLDLDTKARFDKYRLLPQAIRLVQDYGIKKSVELYRHDPEAIRDRLATAH